MRKSHTNKLIQSSLYIDFLFPEGILVATQSTVSSEKNQQMAKIWFYFFPLGATGQEDSTSLFWEFQTLSLTDVFQGDI